MNLIQKLIEKLKPDLPDEEKAALAEELSKEEADGEVVEEKVEEKIEEKAEEPKEEEKNEAAEEVKEEVTEEVKEETEAKPEEAKEEDKVEEVVESKTEEVVEEKPEALKESEAVSQLMALKEEWDKEKAAFEAKIESLTKEKLLVDAQKKLDDAMAAGWLTPAMLKEDAAGSESVFVTIAKEKPEWFERLKLVMAPKVIKKAGITEDSSSLSEALNDDEAKFELINKYAVEHKIPYMEAAHILGGAK